MKQTFKTILIVLLAAALLLPIVACSGTDNETSKTPQNETAESTAPAQPTVSQDASGTKPTQAPTTGEPVNTDEPTTPTDDTPTSTPASEILTLVDTVSENPDYTVFKNNKAEKSNKRTEFYDRESELVVGDDNPWSVKPSTSFVTYNTATDEIQAATVTNWTYEIKVYLKGEDGSFTPAGDEYVDAIDGDNATVDFSDKACGKSFKVEVVPSGLTEKQKQNVAEYTVSVIADVIDGYNVYSAKELAYIDNRNSESWIAFKTANGIDPSFAPASVILQKDISLTKDDLPESFFYPESELSASDSDYSRTLGSLKDNERLYERTVAPEGEFGINGNYFTLSISELPVVTREGGNITPEGEVISHTTLLFFSGNSSSTSKARISSVSFIGNAPRVEDTVKAGGIILNKSEKIDMDAYNNIAICWFITYFPEVFDESASYKIDKCKCYNNFNSFIYNWGCSNLKVSNSEFIGAGGPVLIQDHVGPTDADGGRAPDTTFTNCNLASYVVGTEGWFTVVKASAMVPQIKAMDALFTPFGRSFLKNNTDGSLQYMNLISVTKSGSAQTVTAEKIKGALVLDEHAFDYGASSNPYLAALLELTFNMGAPAFETDVATMEGGYAYTNGAGLFDATQTQIVDPANAIYSGSYLNVYYQGMMFTFGYGPAGETYTA